MGADGNIFQQYLRPVRSVAEYGDDMDRREMNQMQLLGQRRQNDAAAMQMDQQRAAAQQAQAKQNAIQALVARYGADPAALESAALSGADTYDFGKTRRADRLSAEKAAAEAAKAKEESDALRLQRSIQELGVHATARDAIASLDADQTVPPPLKAALRARFQAAGDDPNAYKATLYDMILSRAKPSEQAAGMAPQKAEKPQAMPSAVQEYQFAVTQGYKGTFEQWDTGRKRAGATNVSVGEKPPAGYKWNATGELEPIPGGPADKLPEKQQGQVIGAQNTRNAISEYRDALTGFSFRDAITPDGRAAMGTKYNNMMLQAKEAYNLGVLNGPDLQILQSVITDPRSFQGIATSKAALDAQAGELDRIMKTIADVSSQKSPRGGGSQQPKIKTGAVLRFDANGKPLP